MYIENLIESIVNYCGGDCTATQFISVLRDTIEKLCEDKNICMTCNCELILKKWNEEHPFGCAVAMEEHSAYQCPECGYID